MPPTTSVVGGIVLLVVGVAAGVMLAPALVPERLTTISPAATPPSSTAASAASDTSAPPSQGPTVPSQGGLRSGAPTDPATAPPSRATRHPGPPVRFHSDRLGVDVPVMAIDADAGVLLPPGDPQQLGWWRGGAMPGSGQGRVLITGHTVQAGGGAFDNLARLQVGDTVEVTTKKGAQQYQIGLIQYLSIEAFAKRAPQLLRDTGPERLVLVTCDGWDGTSYQGSTVVIAEPDP